MPELETAKEQAKALIKDLSNRSPTRMSVVAGPANIDYIIEENVSIVVVTEKSYPRKLAFAYLQDVWRSFKDELTADHGPDRYRQFLETLSRPYALLKFDKTLQRLRKEYQDPSSRQNSSRLAEEVNEVHTIMRRNIQEILDRGEKLESVSRISSKLVSDSKKFKWNAKRLNLLDLWKQYAPLALFLLIIIFVLWWRFF